MKKTAIIIMAFAICSVTSFAQSVTENTQKIATNAAGVLTFNEEAWEFGEVSEGPDVTHEFKLKNSGSAPVSIKNASAGCGCTVANWPHEPILPGATASISVTFHTKGRPGAFTKMVTVTSDADRATIPLTIKGSVKSSATVSAH